jgi:hypothetical protein
MADIPLWRLRLNYDFRAILRWGLDHFPPSTEQAEIVPVMETAIRDKAAEIMVDRLQLKYLDDMATAASATDDAVRIDAWKFLDALPKPERQKPDGIINGRTEDKPVQRGLFD